MYRLSLTFPVGRLPTLSACALILCNRLATFVYVRGKLFEDERPQSANCIKDG